METSIIIQSVAASLAGVLVSAAASLIPGLHIYNVIALTMFLAFAAADFFAALNAMVLTGFMLGMVVGFAMLFTVSSQYFQPNDESFRSIMLPHERFLLEGRAHEAVMLGALGSLMAIFGIVLLFPLIPDFFSLIRRLTQHHAYWIIGLVMAFILMTEWPKDHGVGKTGWQRFSDGWVQLGMGYFTFIVAGILGMFVFFKTIVPVENAFQSLMPLFVGLFAVPSQIMTLITNVKVPKQHFCESIECAPHDIARGGFAGFLAGLFASLVPGMTPGPALLCTGHLTVTSGERQFLIAGGVGRVLYYVGSIMLFFMPGLFMRRGGAAINISLFFVPETAEQFYLISGIIAITGAVSFLMIGPFSKLCAYLVEKIDYKMFSSGGCLLLLGLTIWITGWTGLTLLIVSTALGLVPNMWHSRRLNLLAVLMVPVCLNMAGIGPKVAKFFGFY
ncbi:MAG: tripartite tricarboxylate transporter permease [Candidatus Wallbacteria bacterium]